MLRNEMNERIVVRLSFVSLWKAIVRRFLHRDESIIHACELDSKVNKRLLCLLRYFTIDVTHFITEPNKQPER